MTTEMIDKLYLELSQFTTATTQRERLLQMRIESLSETLDRIAKWFGQFPDTGEVWEGTGNPVSWGALYGSNGERDFIREIAAAAIGKSLADYPRAK